MTAAVLFAGWFVFNFSRLAAEQSGMISFMLGGAYALLVLGRKKLPGESLAFSQRQTVAAAIAGVCCVVAGKIVPVHQVEWLGILLILFACLAWALPPRFGRDLLLALLLLYWVHPLPSQVFGPLQLGMQRVSVHLSESLLQIFNVRVWGDGFVLRTSDRVFGVPEACSGMKTAVTVFFCCAGLGLLFRFRLLEAAGLLAAGLVQVLLLNVLRISGIVWFSAGRALDSEKVLHDTMGIFLLLAVGLVHLDAVLLRQWLRRRARRRALAEVGDEIGEDEDRLRRWPEFWRFVFLRWKLVSLLAAVAVAAPLLAYRLRPYHRAQMLAGVVEGLMNRDPATAERAVRFALTVAPDSEELRFDLLTVLYNRGRHADVLALIGQRAPERWSLQERVLKARTLLDLKRLDEVAKLVDAFPAAQRTLPGVAMVLAEFSSAMDKPQDVGVHLANAARGLGTQERIRRLFPYLAARDLWETIRDCDSGIPYATPLQGVIAVESRLRLNDINGAARTLTRAMEGRESEPIFLNPMLRIARERPDTEWVGKFAALFRRSLKRLTPNDLTLAIDGSFVMGRPDLGWLAYRRLAAVAPEDPYLMIAPAEHGSRWFLFRRMPISVAGSVTETTIDAKPFYQIAQALPAWREMWAQIPLAAELGGHVTREQYRKRLLLCLESLKNLEARGALELRLQLLYGEVLGELGRWPEAHAKLGDFEARNPRRHKDFLLAHAALYKGESDWEQVYEKLSEFVRLEAHPPLTVWLDLANATMAMKMGPYAVGVLEEVRPNFPESEEWSLALAGMYGYFGFSEEALFLVDTMKVKPEPRMRARLLMETGRVKEGERLAMVDRLGDLGIRPVQQELPVPAEWALEWRGGTIADADYASEAAAIKESKTVFLNKMNALKLAWYRAKGRGETSDAAAWEAVGRDERERALALSELAILLMRQGRPNDARDPALRAARHRPRWSLVQRLNLILAQDPRLADEAVRQCPWDGEVWLAYLVSKVRAGASAEWAEREIGRAVEGNVYSPGILVRAGDFLARKGLMGAAGLAARKAIREGEGLLSAYVLGIACALKTNDKAWAVACAKAAAEQALEPWPFYKLIVGLKSAKGRTDADVVQALERLTARYPGEGLWEERLGDAYFAGGQMEKALDVLEDAIAREQGLKQANVRTFLLAAEAARREGNFDRSVKILRIGRSRYPDDVNILNNLVYVLAQDRRTVGEAVTLVSALVQKSKEDFAIYDTAALVYTRAGDLVNAERYMKKALGLVRQGDYAWLEVYLNAAETRMRMGKYKEARANLDLIRKNPSRSPDMEARVRELLNELGRREQEEEGNL